jgi:hypothetical protein
MGKLKIELNDRENLRDLLQEAYKLADEQIIQTQNEINKMANATNLSEEAMDSKAKYGKIINDYLGIKDKAISKKLDIAKILTDIYHHNGDLKGALENGDHIKNMDFNFDDIRKIVDDSLGEQEKTKKIQLNKK